ncbi:hypothetical protein [Thalassomonas actiniarum]|uniref:Uncharacterized protein n=1 Tax=Thalassomonas actiniarum TaxID=485447 RepID=A0AAF0C350_9GAMM|nr:hypothetical protein [Thalassomonas actiniarum]WDD98304.1 hypothetical protein SG35_024000 [Thalassomonas actiniarum]
MRKKIIVALASIGMGLGLATSVNAVAGNSFCDMYPDECYCTYVLENYVCTPY